MAFDKEFWLTVGGVAVASVIGWRMGTKLAVTMNKMRRDILTLENCIIELEGKEQLRAERERHEEVMAKAYKKIAENQKALAELTNQTEQDLQDQAALKERFDSGKMTPEQYSAALMKYVP